jgi:hypothetical protein
MRGKILSALLGAASAILIFTAGYAAYAGDEGLVGTWKWEESYYDEDDDETHSYALTLTFGADGVIKMEPFYYDHGADTAYGNYEADGKRLRVTVTEVIPFLEDDGVYFDEGETMDESYELNGDRLVMSFLGGEMVFNRVR